MPSDQDASDELTQTLGELRGEVRALRAEVKRLGAERPALPSEDAPGWDDPTPESHAWVSSLTAPAARQASIPRWIPEVAFLVAVAVAVAVADLEPIAIVAVMAASWAIVALVELALAHGARDTEPTYWAPSPLEQPAQPDPAWFSPPVEHTLLEDGRAPESETAITRLPVAPDTTTVTK